MYHISYTESEVMDLHKLKEVKNTYIVFRVSSTEKTQIKALAKKRRFTLSGLFMSIVDDILKKGA